jgi:dipeptidase D
MALIEYSDTFEHGPFEVLFSDNEETNQSGASLIDGSEFQATSYINLDGTDVHDVIYGCAGVQSVTYHLKLLYSKEDSQYQRTFNISFIGFIGGNSGLNANLEGANAFKYIVAFLKTLDRLHVEYDLTEINGGTAGNAIPTFCSFQRVISVNIFNSI